jgi:redox-sensitive bicupin YhaK (pirin superfamily)
MKEVAAILQNPNGHWVGDGFPVRSLFSYQQGAAALSPFLLLDYAGPYDFPPANTPRGVGAHPHRGFETVTIVYEGEVAHRDSAGHGGEIGPGDVQWMTAASGVVHEEFHAPGFMKSGGLFRMVQLWVNLPAKDKMTAPRYQAITAADIPSVALPDDAGSLRVIAGAYGGVTGPARTFTPLNMWDMRLKAGKAVTLDVPEGHTVLLIALSGRITLNGKTGIDAGEGARLERHGTQVRMMAENDALVLVLTGAPIDEPVFGHGPFVMNTRAEIFQAIEDFNAGRFGRLAS